MNNGDFVKGVNIIEKYVEQDGFDMHSEHDQMWFGEFDAVSSEDSAELEKLGWFEDEDSWSCFT